MPMRPQRARLSAAGVSPWFPLDRMNTSISILLSLIFSSNKNLTANVQFTPDPLVDTVVNISRSTATATVTFVNRDHGLSAGDSVVVSMAGDPLDGTYDVASVVDQRTITYTVANSGVASATDARAKTLRVQLHEVLQGITDDQTSNFAYPPTACRLYVSAYTAGYVDLDIVSGSK